MDEASLTQPMIRGSKPLYFRLVDAATVDSLTSKMILFLVLPCFALMTTPILDRTGLAPPRKAIACLRVLFYAIMAVISPKNL